jgi:hypothetical protein
MTMRWSVKTVVLVVAAMLGSVSIAMANLDTGNDPPHWAAKQLKNSGVEIWPGDDSGAAYEVSRHLPTYMVEGDFDGDSKTDIAILVRRKADEKFGIAVLLRAGTKAQILGAGERFGSGGLDFRWMDTWSARHEDDFTKNARSAWKGAQPKAKRDGLVVAKSGSPRGLIVYDGSKFVWYPPAG